MLWLPLWLYACTVLLPVDDDHDGGAFGRW